MKRLILFLLLALPAWAQHEHRDMGNMPMGDPNAAQQAGADQQMGHHHMDMGAHMKLTPVRPATAADQQRANDILTKTRAAIERYTDVKVAEADGFKMFAPNVKHQHMYHFTNYVYAAEAAFRFNPEHPTSLLYQDDGKGGMKLIGAMFTAPKNATSEELDARVPLSIATWHAHVNLCWPPKDKRPEMFQKNPRFGLAGSISTPEACEAAGGRFIPQVFGWMVHVYPWEADPKEAWSLEKQMHHGD